MPDSSPASFDIAAPHILVVAKGATEAARANSRGHLFERFVAHVFEAYGCRTPTTSNLTVKKDGYELDVVTSFELSNEKAIAECKAYTSPLPSAALNTFYGKLSAERLDESQIHGWFIALPGLTSDGRELARRLEARDKKFRFLNAEIIHELAQKKRWIKPIEAGSSLLSDPGVLVTDGGVFAIAKELDPQTRLPIRVLVQGVSRSLPSDDLALFQVTDFVDGLPVADVTATPAAAIPSQGQIDVPVLVSVVGSSGDFEYQFPAAPAFFVGRAKALGTTKALLTTLPAVGRSLVLNAQSGWGKSSLALKIAAQAESLGGHAVVFDSRTAVSGHYVAAALRQAVVGAESAGLILRPANATYASLPSAVQTLRGLKWVKPSTPLVVFFDQFENVFRDQRLTREFRDLALLIREVKAPILLGFCWKTDQVALTENYPYQLRDEIRSISTVINVDPFGPNDVSTVLDRLAKAAGRKLSLDLRQRIREYSQGLPWLLKKLSSHILVELRSGASEEQLLEEALNIEGLFNQDLASLSPKELEALRLIAREAPVPISDLVERIESRIVQSLVDQRLVVRVGEKLDTYWDIFREFLVTEKVAIEDTFILRQRPQGTAKLLQDVIGAGGSTTVAESTARLGTSENVIFNAARELRQLNIFSRQSGVLALVDTLDPATVTESLIQERVAKALRRHRVFRVIQDLLDTTGAAGTTLEQVALQLPEIYPAVAATDKTWRLYATSFVHWLVYAGLVRLRGQQVFTNDGRPTSGRLLAQRVSGRMKTFPQGRPHAAISYLRGLLDPEKSEAQAKTTQAKAAVDWLVLGVLDGTGAVINEKAARRLLDPVYGKVELRDLLAAVPGAGAAIKLCESETDCDSPAVGALLRDGYGLNWGDSTTRTAGAKFRMWIRYSK